MTSPSRISVDESLKISQIKPWPKRCRIPWSSSLWSKSMLISEVTRNGTSTSIPDLCSEVDFAHTGRRMLLSRFVYMWREWQSVACTRSCKLLIHPQWRNELSQLEALHKFDDEFREEISQEMSTFRFWRIVITGARLREQFMNEPDEAVTRISHRSTFSISLFSWLSPESSFRSDRCTNLIEQIMLQTGIHCVSFKFGILWNESWSSHQGTQFVKP